MSTNHTPNYNLCQWEATDQVLRSDFNQDNAKIDAALAGIPKIAWGSYTGDGAETRTISLPFTPKALLVIRNDGCTYTSIHNNSGEFLLFVGGLAVEGSPVTTSGHNSVAIVENGFQVAQYDVPGLETLRLYANWTNSVYNYLALG